MSAPTYRTKHPYYKYHHALSLKAVIDGMINDRKNREIFCAPLSMSAGSLVSFISQASLWLADNWEVEAERRAYQLWNRQVRRVPKGDRVSLEWKTLTPGLTRELVATIPANSSTPLGTIPTGVEKIARGETPAIAAQEWVAPFDAWVNGEVKEKCLSVTEINLSDDDMVYVRGSLAGDDSVRVVKLDKNNIILERV